MENYKPGMNDDWNEFWIDDEMEEDAGAEDLTYKQIFGKFAENYWNLITKYKLPQMRKSSKGDLSRIEKVFLQATGRSEIIGELEFSRLADVDQDLLVAEVTKECSEACKSMFNKNKPPWQCNPIPQITFSNSNRA